MITFSPTTRISQLPFSSTSKTSPLPVCFPSTAEFLIEAEEPQDAPLRDKEGLRELFYETLLLLPTQERLDIQAYWNAQQVKAPKSAQARKAPGITIGKPLPGCCSKYVLACTNGITFDFLPKVVALAPDDVLQTLIVHELAHAYFRAKGLETDFENEAAEHEEVEKIMLTWGFRDEEIDEWGRRFLGI